MHTGHPERAEAAARAVRELELGWHPVVLMTELAGCWARFDIDGDPRSPGLSPMFPALAGAGVEDEALDLMAQGSQTAVDRFAEAAETWADHDRRGELRCRWAAGEAARRVFDPRATALLTDIETRCAEAGLAGLLGRIRRSLRAAGVRPERASAKAGVLSARERQVLALVSQGLDSIAIAAQLGSARSTVESQLGSAMRKLGAHTRWEAATLLDRDRLDLDSSPR